MSKVFFISEETAARMVGVKPHTLRKYVKWGKWKESVKIREVGRHFQYNEKDLEKQFKTA